MNRHAAAAALEYLTTRVGDRVDREARATVLAGLRDDHGTNTTMLLASGIESVLEAAIARLAEAERRPEVEVRASLLAATRVVAHAPADGSPRLDWDETGRTGDHG